MSFSAFRLAYPALLGSSPASIGTPPSPENTLNNVPGQHASNGTFLERLGL